MWIFQQKYMHIIMARHGARTVHSAVYTQKGILLTELTEPESKRDHEGSKQKSRKAERELTKTQVMRGHRFRTGY